MSNFAKITPIDLGNKPNKATVLTLASGVYTTVATNGAGSATYGVHFKMKERQDKYLIVLKNNTSGGGAATVVATIKGGNSGKWGAGDLAVSIESGKIAIIQIESGCFKNETPNAAMKALAGYDDSSTEDMKGDVVITAPSAGIDVAVIKGVF